jgi:hypothetical protein
MPYYNPAHNVTSEAPQPPFIGHLQACLALIASAGVVVTFLSTLFLHQTPPLRVHLGACSSRRVSRTSMRRNGGRPISRAETAHSERTFCTATLPWNGPSIYLLAGRGFVRNNRQCPDRAPRYTGPEGRAGTWGERLGNSLRQWAFEGPDRARSSAGAALPRSRDGIVPYVAPLLLSHGAVFHGSGSLV